MNTSNNGVIAGYYIASIIDCLTDDSSEALTFHIVATTWYTSQRLYGFMHSIVRWINTDVRITLKNLLKGTNLVYSAVIDG